MVNVLCVAAVEKMCQVIFVPLFAVSLLIYKSQLRGVCVLILDSAYLGAKATHVF